MSEIGSALPYISALRITKRPTRSWQPSGYQNQQGQDLYKQVNELPGIEVEITTYMGEIKGPAMQFKFPSKKFFEDALAELQALPVKGQAEQDAIANIQATLARADVVWCETILLAGELPTLDALWEDAYSDALNEFEKWSDDNRGDGGIPLHLKEMQWNIRVPFESSKTVELAVGLFLNSTDKETDSIHRLLFEDSASSQQRTSYNNQVQQRVNEVSGQIATLPVGPSAERTQLEQQKAAYESELAQRVAVDVATIGALLENVSVQTSLPALILSIIGTLKSIHWPNLDMDLVQQRMLTSIAAIN